MTRPRDSQRKKLYDAEAFLHKEGLQFSAVQEMQDYVDHLRGSAWFERRWPRIAQEEIEVLDGRGRRRGGARLYHLGGIVTMPRWTRNEEYLLHEVSHLCVDSLHSDVAYHGWEFAATLLDLVDYQMGHDAAQRLQESFKAHRVRFRAPRKRAPLTDEQKTVLVERLALARAAKEGAL